MLVEKVSATLALVFVHLRAESYVALCLFHAQLELLQPGIAVAVHELVKLLKPGKHRARRRADDEEGLIADDRFPTSCPVSQLVEIVSTFNIHGFSRSQSGCLANVGDARGAEDLADISAVKLRVETFHRTAVHRQVDSGIGVNFMQRLPQYGSGQDKLVLLPQSRGLGIILNNNRSRAAYYPGEPRGRVANSRGGDHPAFHWRAPRTGRPYQIAYLDVFLRLITDNLLEARLVFVTVHIACHCSSLGWRPSHRRMNASIATDLRPIGQRKIFSQSGRSACRRQNSPVATPCRSIGPDITFIVHLFISPHNGTVTANVEELGDAIAADRSGWSGAIGSSSINGLIFIFMPWIF